MNREHGLSASEYSDRQVNYLQYKGELSQGLGSIALILFQEFPSIYQLTHLSYNIVFILNHFKRFSVLKDSITKLVVLYPILHSFLRSLMT